MLKATPAGLAEQAAGGGGSRKRQQSQKKAKPKKETIPKRQKAENCQNRQAGRCKVEKKGGRWWERRAEESAEALEYEWLSAVSRCRIRTVLSLDLTRRRADEPAEALGYEWLSAVSRCRIRTVLSLDLALRRARPIFGSSPGPQVVST